MSNKASEDALHSLHNMTAVQIAKLIKEAEGDPELMLKVIREARGFLKDNNVSAELSTPVQLLGQEVVNVAELPFEVEEE